jgi:hypothetical protein
MSLSVEAINHRQGDLVILSGWMEENVSEGDHKCVSSVYTEREREREVPIE